MANPVRLIVHTLAQAEAALRAAAEANEEVILDSPPSAARYLGVPYFIAMIKAARAAVPEARCRAVLDCGDAAGLALDALRQGIGTVRLSGAEQTIRRVAAIAAQSRAQVETVPLAESEIDLELERDPLAAARRAFAMPATRSSAIDAAGTAVALIGECMIEIVRAPNGGTAFGYAGDTLNTAVYMARLGLRPSYVTALGTDPFSDGMLDFWRREGVGTELVARRSDKNPGLYIVTTTDTGERRFHYWRSDSAVRTLFTRPEDAPQIEALLRFPMIYWSGISLAVLQPAARVILLAALTRAREAGGRVAFDTNYRARLWRDAVAARAAYEEAIAHADLVFTSLEDEAPIFGGNESDLVTRHRRAGVRELIVKNDGPGSRIVLRGEASETAVSAPPAGKVVDTTAAGDSFSAAYLAARLRGCDPKMAALNGHRLAGAVVGVRGAILPRDRMPEGL